MSSAARGDFAKKYAPPRELRSVSRGGAFIGRVFVYKPQISELAIQCISKCEHRFCYGFLEFAYISRTEYFE